MLRMLLSLRTSSSSGTARRPSDSTSSWKGFSESSVAAGDDEVGARTRQRAREGLPEPSARAGDDRDFAGEIERIASWLNDHLHQRRVAAVQTLERAPDLRRAMPSD